MKLHNKNFVKSENKNGYDRIEFYHELNIFWFSSYIVEKVDNTAYMHAKTMNGQHSVAFLIKLNNENKQLSVEGKSTVSSILA